MWDQVKRGVSIGSLSEKNALNVDPVTGLASDYLNHFYEPLLLLEHISDNPDLIEELADWSPSSYVGHFGRSGRSDRVSVLAAYMEAPPHIRQRLDHVAAEAGQAIAGGLAAILRSARLGEDVEKPAAALARILRDYVRTLSAIIHARD